MPEYKEDGSPVTVTEMVASGPGNITFADYDAAEKVDPYAVEGNDTSNFKGVSEEYRTYASEVDSPLDFDASVADNSVEKLKALGVEVDDEEFGVASPGAGGAASLEGRNEDAQAEQDSMTEQTQVREDEEPSAPESSTDDDKPNPSSTPFPTA